jgi:hypothetical protein
MLMAMIEADHPPSGFALDARPGGHVLLRHAQIDMTMNISTEISDDKTLWALEKLARAARLVILLLSLLYGIGKGHVHSGTWLVTWIGWPDSNGRPLRPDLIPYGRSFVKESA